ncbi:hypothetical protein MFUL124B02_42530 [Myxococcus fulvus 124B02]|nr:hypothetical protein MFUL124B02_42530 [Myxococcus fulvus 124B02]
MTNHHVLPSVDVAPLYYADFEQMAPSGGRVRGERFTLDPKRCFITDVDLDYTLVAVSARSLDQGDVLRYGWLNLNRGARRSPGDPVSMIQHPLGAPKQITIRENKVLELRTQAELPASRLWYTCDVVAGSSGAPVFDDEWRVVAIHSGEFLRDKSGPPVELSFGTEEVVPRSRDEDVLANEGVSIDAILEDIGQRLQQNTHSLVSVLFKPEGVQEAQFGGHATYSRLACDGCSRSR